MNSTSDMSNSAKFFGLTDSNELVMFSADAPENASIVKMNGLDGTLLGIDVRPADGKLYGLTTANKLYTLDPSMLGSGSFSRTATLSDAEEAALLSNNLYVNLHTTGFAPGELRGQLMAEMENDIVQRGIPLEEAQQVNAVPDGPAMGSFDVIYDDATNRLDVMGSFSDLSSPVMPIGGMDGAGNPESAIHIHMGAPGSNGPIVRNLAVEGNTFSGSFMLTEMEEMALLNDQLYVNLHTDGFAAGELRGQIDVDLEGDVVASGIAFEEAQQVNDVPDGPATGAIAITYDNATNELMTMGSYSGLSSALLPIGGMDSAGNPESAVHIHMGAAGANGPIIRTLEVQENGATLVSTLDMPFEGGTISGFDFNPAADRLRLVGDNDQNFRINVDTGAVIVDGTLTFVDDDANTGVNPNTTAVAYTNSFAGTTSTAMYNIDTLLNQLIQQVPPNDGTLKTIGDLGVDFDTLGGFDILSDGMGGNAAFAVSNAMLYSINLETGAAMGLGMIGDDAQLNLQGLAVMTQDDMGGMDMDMDMGDMDMMGVNENDLMIGLYDAETDQLIQLLNDGDSISAGSFDLNNVNLAAFVVEDGTLAGQVGSMQVLINGMAGTDYFENVEPYALFGDARGDFFAGMLSPGEQTVAFEVYSGAQGEGELLATVDRNFTIVPDSMDGDMATHENDLRIGLYDSNTDQLIQILEDGDSLSADSFDLNNVNIAAFVVEEGGLFGKAASMQVLLNGEAGTDYFENVEPYALFGDSASRGDYYQGSLSTGEQMISFEVYSQKQGGGELIATVDRNFTIV